MGYEELVQLGLNGEAPLKLIVCGAVEGTETTKIGVVSVVYATNNKVAASKKLHELKEDNPSCYYMVYSVPLDVDLTSLEHYPSIVIERNDLQ